MERDQFLGRIRSALRGADLPAVAGPESAPPIRFDDPVGRFIAAARAVDAEVNQVDTGDAAFAHVAAAMGNETAYLAWDGLDDVIPHWTDLAMSAGWRRVDTAVESGSRLDDHQRIGKVSVGITGADVAIAATGTVVLTHGPGRPRAASLLVERHVVLVPVACVVHSLDDALQGIDWSTTSNVAAITGPSRTGDIESILTLGVHGPRHLHIVLIG